MYTGSNKGGNAQHDKLPV